jgi:hypothetical protein
MVFVRGVSNCGEMNKGGGRDDIRSFTDVTSGMRYEAGSMLGPAFLCI